MVARAAQISSTIARADGVSPIGGTSGGVTRPPQRTDSRRPSRATRRRGGLVLQPEPGAYARVTVAPPSDWLAAAEHVIAMPSSEALRRRLRVAGVSTVLRACREWAAAADHSTGRGVAISHQTVAERIGYAPATVKRIMRFLTRLGLIVEVVRGANRLTLEQLAEARELGGISQRSVASTRALTIPRSVDGTPLPTPRPVHEESPVKRSLPRRASAHTAGAPRRRAMNEVFDLGGSLPSWRPGVQDFAAELVRRLPRLLWTSRSAPRRVRVQLPDGRTDLQWVGGRHIGQVCSVIARERLVERGWTVAQVLQLIDEHRATLRVDVDPAEQRDPLAWLVWLIRRAIGQDQLSPRLQAQRDRDQARAENENRRAEAAQRRHDIEAQQPEIDRIIADMHRRFPRRPRPRRS